MILLLQLKHELRSVHNSTSKTLHLVKKELSMSEFRKVRHNSEAIYRYIASLICDRHF